MYYPSIIRWALLLIVAINSCFLRAQEVLHEDVLVVNDTLTLNAVIEKALPRYPNSQLLTAKKIEVESRQIYAQGLLPAPASLQLRNQNDRLLSARGESEWEAGVMWPIWLSGQKKARQAIAEVSAQQLSHQSQSIRLQLAGLVRDALWDIQLANGLAELANSKYKAISQLERDVEMRVRLGDLAQKDLLVAQTETLQAKAEKTNADAEVQHANFRYINLTGLHELPAEFIEVRSNQTEITSSHPALLEANGKIEFTDEQRRLTTIETRDNPTVLFGARSIRGGFDTQFNSSLGVTLTIPLSGESRNAPLRAAAEMQYAEAQTSLSQLKLLLANALHEAEHNLEVGQTQLALLRQQQTVAQQSLAVTNKAFQAGELDLNDYLRVQAQAFQVERALKNQQIQQSWNIARYNQAVGEQP